MDVRQVAQKAWTMNRFLADPSNNPISYRRVWTNHILGEYLRPGTLTNSSTYFQTCWEAWLQLYRATYDKPFTEFGPYLPKHIPAKEGPDQPNTPIELKQIYSALQATRLPKVNQKTVGQREIEALFGTNIEQIFAVVASVKCTTARDTLFRFFARIMKRTPADTNTICYACHTVFDGDTHTSPIIHHLEKEIETENYGNSVPIAGQTKTSINKTSQSKE
ncbi:Pol protein [Cavenderia fasciculata]|uniref:Pol protein n=1 Tax=Cavenderia fasciculata TaxID=261658 RepID=F4Q717_CACFS|nr:Pol protein [Cavenderia fasciculata]EGG16199.1 Pol protein [Cavenderia fasciculata]|eukprot:XP_004354583.1 Pol protein [Cavenderia fasciculata]